MHPSVPSITAAIFLTAPFSTATVVDQVGAAAFWDTGGGAGITWTAFGGTDGADYTADSGNFDFVSSVASPGLYYAETANYIFFRMRVNAGSIGTTPGSSPYGTYALLLDIATDPNPTTPVGSVAPLRSPIVGTTGIDYAIVWDSSNKNDAGHGLEMSRVESGGLVTSKWSGTKLNDIDNSDGTKGVMDINGLTTAGGSTYRSGDGYVRTTDSQSTTDFGNTTLIDFAVSWSYLENYTLLNRAQQWDVTLATDQGSNDHQLLIGDVYGAPNSENNLISGASWISTSWSAVPEPGNFLAGVLLAAGLLRRQRRNRG